MASYVGFYVWSQSKSFNNGVEQTAITISADSNTTVNVNPSSSNIATYAQAPVSKGVLDVTFSVTDKNIVGAKIYDKALANDITSNARGYGINLDCENGVLHLTVDTDNVTNLKPFGNELTSSTFASCYIEFVYGGSGTEHIVNKTLENCTINIENDTIPTGINTITLTADSGYMFNNVPVLTMNDTNYDFTVSADKTSAEITLDINNDITVVANAEKIVIYYPYTETLSNCRSNINSDTIADGTQTIILTANSGYEFAKNGTVTINGIEHSFVISEDKQTATLTDTINGVVNVVMSATKIIEKLGTFTNLYTPTETELSELAKVRFVDDIDYGQYITALFKIPFEIPSELIAEVKRNIVLGTLNTTVKSNALLEYNLVVNIGSITIPEKYENVYDYLDVECVLHLPYFDKVYLNTETVIGQTITVEYIIDLYSGNATCNIYSTFTGGIVESVNGVIACNIPFIQKQNNNVVGVISNFNKNVFDTAYMEVTRNIPYNIDTVFGAETIDFGTIGDYTGFIKVSEVVLNSSATNEEKTEIINLLKEGVTINEN